MRLINTDDYSFMEFHGENIPLYAILSHTWTDCEAVYTDWVRLAAGAPGCDDQKFDKVKTFCRIAQENGFTWVWADTVCMDKSSSAELSEAINSMYEWYKQAMVCYVYLADLASSGLPLEKSLGTCRWFTRGWTLQELIAPTHVVFFDREWHDVGTKRRLSDVICAITGIDQDLQIGRRSAAGYSIAQRMSWAASRNTTRIEDRAYSLLGLFEVNMPMLYGEGRRAFRRLQHEILSRNCHDSSIFAWRFHEDSRDPGHRWRWHGFLAPSPDEFWDSSRIVPMYTDIEPGGECDHIPFVCTVANQGIQLSLRIRIDDQGRILGVLPCLRMERHEGKIVAIQLEGNPVHKRIGHQLVSLSPASLTGRERVNAGVRYSCLRVATEYLTFISMRPPALDLLRMRPLLVDPDWTDYNDDSSTCQRAGVVPMLEALNPSYALVGDGESEVTGLHEWYQAYFRFENDRGVSFVVFVGYRAAGHSVNCQAVAIRRSEAITKQELYENLTAGDEDCLELTPTEQVSAKVRGGVGHNNEGVEVPVVNLWVSVVDRSQRRGHA